MIIQPPKDFSMSKMKDIVAILQHVLSEIKIDDFGFVTGLSQNLATIVFAEVHDPIFIKYFGSKYIDLRQLYPVISLKKNQVELELDNNGHISLIKSIDPDINIMCQIYDTENVPNIDVLDEKYNENAEALKKEIKEWILYDDSMLNELRNDLIEMYVHVISNGPTLIKDFIPKPKKITGFRYAKLHVIEEDGAVMNYWKSVVSYGAISISIVTRELSAN